MFEIKDKVFLITGGGAGIGAGMVRSFLEEGAKHVASLDLDVANGKTLEAEMAAQYGNKKIRFYKCDVTTKDLDDVYAAVIEEFGYIDCVVNNAGIMNDSPKMFLKEIEVNVTSLIRSSMIAYGLMRKDHGGKGGTVINISSIAALIQIPTLPIYHGTKSAVMQFTNCMGMEPHWSRSQVRMITICFGCTDTSLLHSSKYNCIDKESDEDDLIGKVLRDAPIQKLESAVKGVVDAFKAGTSGSTWLVSADKPARDVTDNVRKGYEILSEGVFDH